MQPAPFSTVAPANPRSDAARPTHCTPLQWTPSRYDAVGVVIAAHNGEHEIESCVRGVFAANKLLGWAKPLWIVIVADACTDRTARTGRAAAQAFGEVISIAARSEAKAREIGTDAILNHFRKLSRGRILVSHICAGRQASEFPGARDATHWRSNAAANIFYHTFDTSVLPTP